MARGRLIEKDISLSITVNKLSDKFAFIYTWLGLHIDDHGYIPKSPEKLKAMAFPMRKSIRAKDIEEMLTIGLIINDNGKPLVVEYSDCYQLPGVINRQSLSPEKKSKSVFEHLPKKPQESPEIPRGIMGTPEIPKNPQKSPPQDKLREDKLREDNSIKDNTTAVSDKSLPAVGKLDFVDRKFTGITDRDIADWETAYLAIDIKQEINKAEQWVLANPKNKKSNWRRFLINWFSRSQDKAPAVKTQTNLSKEPNQPSMNPDVGKLNAKIRNVARSLKPERPLTPEQKKANFEQAKKMAVKYNIKINEDVEVKV